MTNQEAIEIMQTEIEDNEREIKNYITRREIKEYCSEQNQAYKLAIAALEKQEPKVPPEISWEYDYFKCPSCGKLITSTTGIDTHKYCLECGQALTFEGSDAK